MSIKGKNFLTLFDHLISSNKKDINIVELNEVQNGLLKMSEDDIENGRLISQDIMDKENMRWLNEI